MIKAEKEYLKTYGAIPKDSIKRMDYLLNVVIGPKKRAPNWNLLEEINKIRSIGWETIKYTIYLVPKGTPRPRNSRNHFYVSGASDNKKVFEGFIKDNPDLAIIRTACKMRCDSYLPIPGSMKDIEKILAELGFIRPTSKPDFDNLVKTYADMIQGTLLYDDALIVDGRSRKYYSVKPRIEITLRYMKGYDSDYNRKKMINKK